MRSLFWNQRKRFPLWRPPQSLPASGFSWRRWSLLKGNSLGRAWSPLHHVDLNSFSFISDGELKMTLFVDNFPNSLLSLPKFYWSGIYTSLLNPLGWEWLSVAGMLVLVRIISLFVLPRFLIRLRRTIILEIVGI